MLQFAQAEGGLAPLFEDHGVPLAIMGILVVFAALALVSLFISYLPRVMAILDRLHPEKRERPVAPVKKPSDDEELTEETLAVIAAAAAEMLGDRHRIVHIRGLTPEDLGWSLEGRIQHHTSHKIHRRDGR